MQLDIESIFSYHPPRDASVAQMHQDIRDILKSVAEAFQADLPECAEKTLAIRKLQEAMMYANSAIAQHG